MDNLYSIGKASKICDVSPRMLRYYEELGIIKPAMVSEGSNYRYYSIENLRRVHAIRYFVDQGFSLDQIKSIILNDDIDAFQDLFIAKIEETEKEIEHSYQRLASLKGWCALLIEGKQVLKHPAFTPSVRYFPEKLCFFYKHPRKADEADSDVHLEIEYYTESKKEGHTMVDVGGAFSFYYSSFEDKLAGTHQEEMLIQMLYENSSSTENTFMFGGWGAITAYHVGPYDGIPELYDKMKKWAADHNFLLRGDSLERHVLDIYSTRNPERFVTEIILPIAEDSSDMAILDDWKQMI